MATQTNNEPSDWQDAPIDDWQDVPTSGPATSDDAVADLRKADNSAIQDQAESHDLLPTLKQVPGALWQGMKDTAGALASKPLPSIAYDKFVRPAVDEFKKESDVGEGTISAGLGAADKLTGTAADTATNLVPSMTPVKAYIRSRQAGNSVEDALKDARNAGVVVGGLGAAGAGVGKLANVAAPAVEDAADASTLKALGPTINQQEALANRGAASDLAKSLRDEGVVTAGSTPKSMLPRLEDYLSAKGARIGEIRDAADAAGASTDMTRLQNMARIQQEAAQGSNEAGQAMADAYSRNADRFATVPNRTLAQTQDEIMGLNSQIPFQKDFADMTPAQQAFKELRGDLADQMKDQIQLRTPENAEEYNDALKQFSLFKNAEPILDKAAARQAVRGSLGLKDIMTGALGENGVQRGTFAVLSKLAREHGASTAAVSLGRMADLMQTNPAALGQFGTVLGAAAQKGPEAVQAAHAAFMANPDYTKRLGGAP